MNSIDQAIASLESSIDDRLKAHPLTKEWFELQAYGRGITLLKTIKLAGLENDPQAVDDYRRMAKVLGEVK